MSIEPGENFSEMDVRKAGERARIRVRTKLDGWIVGGMTYSIDPTLKRPSAQRPARGAREAANEAAEELLETLDLPGQEVDSVRIKRVTVDIDLDS
jgi:hypothetical protein